MLEFSDRNSAGCSSEPIHRVALFVATIYGKGKVSNTLSGMVFQTEP